MATVTYHCWLKLGTSGCHGQAWLALSNLAHSVKLGLQQQPAIAFTIAIVVGWWLCVCICLPCSPCGANEPDSLAAGVSQEGMPTSLIEGERLWGKAVINEVLVKLTKRETSSWKVQIQHWNKINMVTCHFHRFMCLCDIVECDEGWTKGLHIWY